MKGNGYYTQGFMKVVRILIYFAIIFFLSGQAIGSVIIDSTSVIETGDEDMWSPVWSPDGRSIAYIAFDKTNIQQIFTINTDGSGKKQVTNEPNKKWGLNWIDEGISFVAHDTDGLQKIFIIKPDGSGIRKLIDEKVRQGRAPWDDPPSFGGISQNPVTNKIVFTSFDETGSEKIFEVNPDGTGKKQLIDDTSRQWDADWSPDGRSLVYVSYDSKNNEQFFTVNADGTGKKQITFDNIKKSDPNWGQGGILFVSYESKESSGENIFLIEPDGTDKEIISDSGFKQRHPRWDVDGYKIIFEDIDFQGTIEFKVLELQKPLVTPVETTPIITATPVETPVTTTPEITATPVGEIIETPLHIEPEEPHEEVEEHEETNLVEVVYTMFLVMFAIIAVLVLMLIVSDIMSKNK